MFSHLVIDSFKSFSKLEIGNLSRINLFFGKNNCGKTTLLESIFILSGMSNPELPLKCNQFRDFARIKDSSLFFHNLNTDKNIIILSKSNLPFFDRKVEIQLQRKNVKEISNNNALNNAYSDTSLSEVEELLFLGSVKKLNSEIESLKTVMKIREQKNSEKIQFSLSPNYKENIVCSYFSPKLSLATIIPSVLKIFSEKQEKIVVKALQNIDSRIRDFILVENTIMVDIGLEKRLPLNLLGDGVRKFFTLVVGMFESRNGILLVDEIDNGLHFSTMEQFWKILLDTAHLFNVQLFATTHNIDSIKGLNQVLLNSEKEGYRESVSAYKLIKHTDDTNSALYYDFKSFSDLIASETEIR